MRERQLPRADPAAQARRRGTQVRQVRLRAAALCAARTDVHLRHRAVGGQHRRVPGECAGDPRRVPEAGRVGRALSRRVLRAVAEPRSRRRAENANPRRPGDHLCRVGLPGQRQVPAARLPPGHAHPVVGLQRGGLALRPPRQARAVHTGQGLPADDGARAGRRRVRPRSEEANEWGRQDSRCAAATRMY